MIWSKHKRLFLIAAGIGLIILAIVIIFFILHKPNKKPNTNLSTNAAVNTISDSSTGLSFNISKNFEPMSREALSKLNPDFGYGFKSSEDPNLLCIVSSTKLQSSGAIMTTALRDGLIKEISKIHPDVKLDNPQTATKLATFGQANGVLLQVSYTDGTVEVKRVEIIALGKTVEVIAYCQSASIDAAKYYNDFTTLFSSLKVSK